MTGFLNTSYKNTNFFYSLADIAENAEKVLSQILQRIIFSKANGSRRVGLRNKREPPLLRMVLEQIRIILIEKHIARDDAE